MNFIDANETSLAPESYTIRTMKYRQEVNACSIKEAVRIAFQRNSPNEIGHLIAIDREGSTVGYMLGEAGAALARLEVRPISRWKRILQALGIA